MRREGPSDRGDSPPGLGRKGISTCIKLIVGRTLSWPAVASRQDRTGQPWLGGCHSQSQPTLCRSQRRPARLRPRRLFVRWHGGWRERRRPEQLCPEPVSPAGQPAASRQAPESRYRVVEYPLLDSTPHLILQIHRGRQRDRWRKSTALFPHERVGSILCFAESMDIPMW